MLGAGSKALLLTPGFWWISTALLSTYVIVYAHIGHITCLFERVMASVPLAWAISAWLAYLFASLRYHTLDARAIRDAWLLHAVLGLFHLLWIRRRRMVQRESDSCAIGSTAAAAVSASHRVGVGIVAMTAVVVWPMVSSRFLKEDPSGAVLSGGATWADLPFHMNIAASFLYGTNREFDYRRIEAAFYAGSRLVYPLLPDFHSACLRVAGMSWRLSFLLPALFLAVSGSGLLYAVNWRLTGNRAAAALSVVMVMCAGGTGAFEHWRQRGWSHATRVAWDVDPVQADNEGGKREILWFAYFGHVFLPQRPATYAMPLILVFILLIVLAVTEGVSIDQSAALLRLAAFVAGILPLFQAHAFLGAVIICAVLFVMDMDRWVPHMELLWKGWLSAACIGLALSAPQLPVYLGRVASPGEKKSFLRFSWTAMASFNRGFWRTWFRALTLHVPLYVFVFTIVFAILLMQALADLEKFTGLRCYRPAIQNVHKSVMQWLRGVLPAYVGPQHQWRMKLFPPFMAVFVFCNLVLIQPWVKDNVKLVYVWLFQASGMASYLMVRLWRRGGLLGKILLPFILFVMLLSGFLGMRREWGGVMAEIFPRTNQEVAEWIRMNTHWKSVFLTGEEHVSPACALGGRSLFIGYLGWVWSHGLPNIYERVQLRDTLFRSQDRNGTELLQTLRLRRISHILLDPQVPDPDFESIFDSSDVWLAYENNGWRLYFVKDVVLGDRPIEFITREQLFFATGISWLALWMAALCMWHFSRICVVRKFEEDGNGLLPHSTVAGRRIKAQ
ncbi:hypothetical protein F1559_003114 [Cyanidiococcus yangmingshanensis]|uniref:Uncharacterized protein n=1 Tax=Cyanidiococcus yangmingshanensis TaxID=2690220 RepID=A0A7J7IM34_9RHOD|nr:hypothetical protein F1559_003114 [Cyanidiococcus yangmingshanensis]